MDTAAWKWTYALLVLQAMSGMAVADDLRLPTDAASRINPATASCDILTCRATDHGSLPFTTFTRVSNWGLELFDHSYDSVYQDGRTKLAIEASLANFRAGGFSAFAGGDPDDKGPFQACVSADSSLSAAQWEALNAAMLNGFMTRYNASTRWSGGTNGTPRILLWSFVPDGTSVLNGLGGTQNSTLFASMDSKFGGIANRATWIGLFQQVFNRWSDLTGLTYTRVTFGGTEWDDGAAWGSAGAAGARGDVRIAMKNIDGVNNVLAYNSFPDDGDMVVDSSEAWGSTTANNYRYLRNVLSHEHGHGLGMSHVCPIVNTKLMEPATSNNPPFDGPQHDDVRGVMALYGDFYENSGTATNNDSTTNAYDLGALAAGSSSVVGVINTGGAIANSSRLSIDSPNDRDYFKVSVDQPRLLNVTATPRGTTYTESDQLGNGACSTTTVSTNSLASQDLVIEVYGGATPVLLRSDNDSAIGVAEVSTNLVVPSGNVYVRASSSSGTGESQMYTLTISLLATSLTPTATDGTSTTAVDVSWPSIPDATGFQIYRAVVNSFGAATNRTTTPLAGTATSWQDTSANPGVTYYYWVRVQQPGSTAFRNINDVAETGFRGLANVPPTAVAGADLVVTDVNNNGSEPVTLDGSLSTDSDGTITNYRWNEGATILTQGATSSQSATLTAGTHTLTLTVTDNANATGTDTLNVLVNRPPSANAGVDQTVTDSDQSGTESVSVSANASSDPDGTIVSYVWTEGPTTLASGATPSASFSLGTGTHTITLTVTDNNGATSTDTVSINVNVKPTASAGTDITVTDTDNSGAESVTLNGSLSSDSDGTITSYVWTNGATQIATGVSPSVSMPVGVATLTLTVTDNNGATASDTVLVTVNPGTPPGPTCNDLDFNNDGNIEPGDVDAYFSVLGEGPCLGDTGNGCDSLDFNNDGNIEPEDVDAYFSVLGEGPCIDN